MSDGKTGESKAELEKELKDVDEQVGDDQSGNPRRDKFTTLYGGGGESAESSPSTTSTTSTTSTSATTDTTE